MFEDELETPIAVGPFFSLGMDGLFLQVGEPFLDPLMTLLERRKKG